eukprot:scaffold265134_cov17-Tisochrysis_lutea.AAC.1
MPEFQHFSLHFEGNRSRGKEGEAEVKKESFTLADWPRAFRKEPPIDSHLYPFSLIDVGSVLTAYVVFLFLFPPKVPK